MCRHNRRNKILTDNSDGWTTNSHSVPAISDAFVLMVSDDVPMDSDKHPNFLNTSAFRQNVAAQWL